MEQVSLQTKLKNLPNEPGVYIMYDADGNILYVGKAKILKNRVRQYFHASTNKTEKVLAMLSHVADFRYIITASEADALSLENTLIKKHTPPYNILLKDDKQYPYIKVDLHSDFAKFVSTRKLSKDRCKYFGPLTQGGSKAFLDILSTVFPTITCNYNFKKLPKNFRPCLNYHIGKCCAPCVGKISKQDYRKIVDGAVRFLEGDDDTVKQVLREKMMQASDKMQYEQALTYKRYLQLIEKLNSQQIVVLPKFVNYDMFAVASNGKNCVVNHTMIRGGKVVFSNNIAVSDAGLDEAQTLSSFLAEYCDMVQLSKEWYTNLPLPDAEELQQLVERKTSQRVKILCPKRQEKKKLVDMSYRNAVEYLTKSQTAIDKKFNTTQGAVLQLKQLLNLKQMPTRVECYDISNVQGVDKVASMVVFTNGQKDASQYRRFKIKMVEGANDFASMKEVLVRRFERMKADDGVFGKTPDLIVVDGGLGQLQYARQAMEECGVEVQIVSLAKREELVYTLQSDRPVYLPRNSYALNLLINVRDESHRFAITYFRKLHNKNSIKSVLQDVDGIGEKRRVELHRKFRSMDNLKNATVEEIASVKGMTRPVAEKLYEFLHGKS
ncbi:MAG TPA: excinuclease ABC subunit UvrC [Candidatus Fimimonas gallinarum]|uniref:UvrABC system protein C n=1 Tax=Candidatus Fimimonas gallinarum TaxID=2840821 RepID=A0A9D1E3D2_9BACT|nr:excinuclease ABC subunit UvrC [Candidatus Fimimonas gallinarum]